MFTMSSKKMVIMFTILLTGYPFLWAQTYSTLQGGPWSAPSTWQDGVVPSAADNVVLIGPVQLDAGGDYYVNSLTIRPNGELTLVTNLPETRMHVAQDVVNEGKVIGKSNLTPLYFYIGGDLINAGEWRTYTVYFTDTLTHLLRAEPGSYFSPSTVLADSAHIVSDRDAFLYNVHIRIGRLELRKDFATQELTTFWFLEGSTLQVDEILAQGNAIGGDSLSFVNLGVTRGTPIFHDIRIKGETLINTHLHIQGDIVIEDTLRFKDLINYDRTITVTGNVTNQGALLENSWGYTPFWECGGNIRNEGVWNRHPIKLTGMGTRTLFTDLNYPFSPRNFYAPGVTVVSESPLRFDDVKVQIKKLVLQPGNDLYLQLNSTFQVDSLIGNFNRLHCNDASQLFGAVSSSTKPVFQDIIFAGIARLNAHIEFLNSVVIEGTLQLQDYTNTYRNVFVKGNIENRGRVALNNWGYGIVFYIDGNLQSNGDWESNYIELTGAATHRLFIHPDVVFRTYRLEASNAVVLSDTSLHFDGGTIEIGKLVLQPGHSLYLNQGTIFRVDTLEGNGNTLFCRGDSRLSYNASGVSKAIYRNIILADTVDVEYDIIFENELTINGILKIRDLNNNNYQMIVKGDVINNGHILPNSWNYSLMFIVEGNLENNGFWQAQRVDLSGTQTQRIAIPDSANFQATLKIDAMRRGNGYQWFKDGLPLTNSGNTSGATHWMLSILKVTPAEYGTYQCRIDSSGDTLYSRRIVIGSSITGISETTGPDRVPERFQLLQNYPNPFNPVTTIRYQLPRRARVQLVVYDVLGRPVQVLVDGVQKAGYYSHRFDASHLPSGVYFYHLKAGGFSQVRKMLLQK